MLVIFKHPQSTSDLDAFLLALQIRKSSLNSKSFFWVCFEQFGNKLDKLLGIDVFEDSQIFPHLVVVEGISILVFRIVTASISVCHHLQQNHANKKWVFTLSFEGNAAPTLLHHG